MIATAEFHKFAVTQHDFLTKPDRVEPLLSDEVIQRAHADAENKGGTLAVIEKFGGLRLRGE